jgi:3-dehydroquinate dehydratase/shikimate dehydrogenase
VACKIRDCNPLRLNPLPSLTTQHLRTRIGKVCVAIIGATAAEMIEKASATVKATPFLEFRLDYLEKPALALPKIKQFLADNTAATAIATCRLAANGGRFEGTPASELDILLKAAAAGFQIVDLELETAEILKKSDLQTLRDTGVGLIISHHNFKETKDLDAIYERIAPFAPDFIKIVPTARTLADNVTLIRFLERMSDHANIVGICMGDAGVISRVLGLRAGSIFTFAAISAGEETGPGQIAARTLVETFRIQEVDAATKVYGVAGNPVGKSLSPVMMNAAFKRETVNAVYLALQTSKVDDLVTLIREIPIHGVSITMPHKQDILPYLEHMDPLSKKIGACNTVLRVASGEHQGKLYGFNTDVAGIITPLERRISLKDARVLVLGAGGSARAAVFGLRDKGAEVFIYNRTLETATKLARQSGAKAIKREAIPKTQFDIIINATPIGMAGQKAAQILTAEDFEKFSPKLVFDLVYNPADTPLIRLARAANIPVITGVEMFVQQGARQFEIWTGKPAPEEEMLRVVVHALRPAAEPIASTPAAELAAKKAKSSKT